GGIQFMIAGVDFIPLGELPEGVPVATNGGGYAESMAEHALAMALAGHVVHLMVAVTSTHRGVARGRFAQSLRCCRPPARLLFQSVTVSGAPLQGQVWNRRFVP